MKICGITDEDNTRVAIEAGADAIGFVLTDSPRQLPPERAYELTKLVPRSLQTVAVFAKESPEQIIKLATAAGVDAVQLHGSYPREAFEAVDHQGFNVIRAVSGIDASELDTGAWGEDLLLVDAPEAGAGHRWDFSKLSSPPSGRWLLAGGLTPDNVAQAISEASPWGVDVSSGVESSRGVKDPVLIQRFIEAAKKTD